MGKQLDESECVWQLASVCDGKIKKVRFFEKQITICACEKHISEHRDIMILAANGYSYRKVMRMKLITRRMKVEKLIASGVDVSKIKL